MGRDPTDRRLEAISRGRSLITGVLRSRDGHLTGEMREEQRVDVRNRGVQGRHGRLALPLSPRRAEGREAIVLTLTARVESSLIVARLERLRAELLSQHAGASVETPWQQPRAIVRKVRRSSAVRQQRAVVGASVAGAVRAPVRGGRSVSRCPAPSASAPVGRESSGAAVSARSGRGAVSCGTSRRRTASTAFEPDPNDSDQYQDDFRRFPSHGPGTYLDARAPSNTASLTRDRACGRSLVKTATDRQGSWSGGDRRNVDGSCYGFVTKYGAICVARELAAAVV